MLALQIIAILVSFEEYLIYFYFHILYFKLLQTLEIGFWFLSVSLYWVTFKIRDLTKIWITDISSWWRVLCLWIYITKNCSIPKYVLERIQCIKINKYTYALQTFCATWRTLKIVFMLDRILFPSVLNCI